MHKKNLNNRITFERATLKHKAILRWLYNKHVIEFWDNSPEHKLDILNFIGGRKTPSTYFNGIFSYWIGFVNNEPFSLIMTSEIKAKPDMLSAWLDNISKTGKTISLDFMIGNESYLGQGLAAPTLIEFMKYFKTKIEPEVDTFFIDPVAENTRAKRVYEKAGFEVKAEFNRDFGEIKNLKHYLMVKKAYFNFINSSSR